MTGTASRLEGYNKTTKKLRYIRDVTAWLFGQNQSVVEACTLVDISEGGGAILVPKNLELPSNVFDVVVQLPDVANMDRMSVRAERRWIDNDYSKDSAKLGFRFLDNPLSRQLVIRTLINHTRAIKKAQLDCRLIF